MSIDQYNGRTVDIAFFKDSDTAAQNPQGFGEIYASGAVLTGIRKLAQRYVLELFTRRGSLAYRSRRGSSFLDRFHQGTIRTSADIFQAFAIASGEVQEALTAEEQLTDPDDERFASATLLSATVNGLESSITVSLKSLAGSEFTLIQPIDVSLR